MSVTASIMRTKEEIIAFLKTDPNFWDKWIELIPRIESGDLVFEFGDANWRPEHFRADAWEERSFSFAFCLARRMPEIKKFKLYYHIDHCGDYHYIDFELAGEKYSVRMV